MFQNLHIQGYRRFKDYRLENLSRVNLLVGDNNSGKTSVLEAAFLLAMNDPHDVFRMIAERRGERAYFQSETDPHEGRWYPTLKHCWTNGDLSTASPLVVDSGEQRIELEVLSVEDTPHHDLAGRFQDKAVRFKSSTERRSFHFGIDLDGVFDSIVKWDKRNRPRMNAWLLDSESNSMTVRHLWDQARRAGNDARVLDALRALVEDVDRLHFDGIPTAPWNPRTGVNVGTTGRREMQPIGSFGQGVYRMLELALYLVASEDGVFLVDEIDNGFHWTRMADIWKFVIETAKETNTQVFATTHSEDCIKGLAWVCSTFPELAQEVSVQSLKSVIDFAIDLPGERLPSVLGSAIEVR